MGRKDPLASLYAGPIESFTAARKKLAAKLAAKGEKALAAKVRGAAKPTRAAWVLDRLPHDAADELKTLYAAGDRMRKSQHGSATEAANALRDATAARAKALGALERAARKILETQGYASPHALLRSVTNVLRNASVDQRVREQLAAGAIAKTDEIESEALPSFASAVKKPRERETHDHSGPVPAIRAGVGSRERDSGDEGDEVEHTPHRAKPRLRLVRNEPAESTRERHTGTHAKKGGAKKPKRHAIDTRAHRAAEHRASRARNELERARAAVHAAEEKLRAAEARSRDADEHVRRLRGR
jgi:hypothetical protein